MEQGLGVEAGAGKVTSDSSDGSRTGTRGVLGEARPSKWRTPMNCPDVLCVL